MMDNFICSIPLFRDLKAKAIYATGTMRSNQIELPSHLKNTRAYKRCGEGHIEWAMHDSRGISYIMWKDKCLVLLISTQAIPIGFPYMLVDTVPRKHGAVREKNYHITGTTCIHNFHERARCCRSITSIIFITNSKSYVAALSFLGYA
jgi:hypothetical protein